MSEITRADYQATVREREALRARIAELEQQARVSDEKLVRLKAALNAAAMSLETIDEQAGRDIYLKHMDQVRGYAHSRSLAARAAFAQMEPTP